VEYWEKKNVFPILKSLGERGLIFIGEEILDKRKPKKEIWYQLHPDYQIEEKLIDLMDVLERRAVRQAEGLKPY